MTNSYTPIACALLCLTLVGCGWVDSTGQQGGRDSGGLTSIEAGGALIADGSVSLNENTTKRFPLLKSVDAPSTWTWRFLPDENDVSLCQTEHGLDGLVAETSLTNACSNPADCELQIQEFTSGTGTVFDVRLPTLSAPVALAYSLETTLSSGETYSQRQTVCGIAINEAPSVVENHYLVLANQIRTVEANDPFAVLKNDNDDEHVRNQPLFIEEITSAPRYADNLFITADGAFRYTPSADLYIAADEQLEDRVDLIVSDGVHSVPSVIHFRLVASSIRPNTVQQIPATPVILDDDLTGSLELDVSGYVSDADGDPLQFRLESSPLVDAGKIQISDAGLITGSFTQEDFGTEEITVISSDGLHTFRQSFTVQIRDNRPTNTPPEVTDIPNRTVSGNFEYDVSPYFSDADGDALTFSSTNLPPGTTLSAAGLLTGTANAQNDGRWLIRVEATDNRGGTVTDQFRLVVND